ncbi:hypothetical protein [Mycobacterium sp. URHB0021]
MKATQWQIEWAVRGLWQNIELSKLLGIRVRRELRDVCQQLDDLLMFADEHESDCGAERLEPDLMGSKAVAAELRCTPEHVGRIAKDIGGLLVEGHWVFRRHDVSEYKAWKATLDDCG